MKEYSFFLFFMFLHLGFSQNEKLIHGRIICDKNVVQGVEIINLVSEKNTISDSNGDFYILAKAENMLVFISKNYEYKRKFLESSDIETNNIKIELIKKPEELDEVVITQKPVLTGFEDMRAIINKPYFDDAQSSPATPNVYNGKTPGIDFIAVIGLIGKLIKGKDSKKTKPKSTLDFEEVVENSENKIFFEKTLLLKKDEIALFVEFCAKDEKVNHLLEPNKILELMDFFFHKSKEFKMLPNLTK
jgi:hypothetical protein